MKRKKKPIRAEYWLALRQDLKGGHGIPTCLITKIASNNEAKVRAHMKKLYFHSEHICAVRIEVHEM